MGLVRLLPLLLLLLPPGLRELLSPPERRGSRPPANDAGVGGEVLLHPLFLVPGVSCSELEARLTDTYRPSSLRCGAMKGKGWFALWQNCTDLQAHHYVECFQEQMSLVYDPAANEFRNRPGVETRVLHFGSTETEWFERNPIHPEWCLAVIRRKLEEIGYRDGDTLFGAPYDLRHVPPVPGQTSRVFSRYFKRLARLVERASNRTQRRVILFGHSYGGMVALDFVRSMPPAWRDRYIKHLILVAPTIPTSGLVKSVKNIATGTTMFYVPNVTALSLRPMWRTFESALINFPSPAVFGDKPLVITRRRNYSAHDMADFIADVTGSADAVEAFRRREVPKMRYFEAPMVDVTCINGVGTDTPEQLVYWDGDFDAEPELVYGDGDDLINLASMLAFDEQMRRQPGQRQRFKSIKIDKARHDSIIIEESSLKQVLREISDANRI